MTGEVPELPNFIQFIYRYYANDLWARLLYHWENLIFALFIGLTLSLVFFFGLKKKGIIPSPFQNFLEWIMESFQKLILGVIGREGSTHLPFLGTLFIYILCMNWFGLIPFMKSPSTNINVTAALALCVFFYVQYYNIRNRGFWGFLYHLIGEPQNAVGWILAPLMIVMELIAQISRPITLALRLSGNMLGEHILLGVFALMGIVWLSFFSIPLTFPLQIPFVIFALFTGLMQALVFTILSSVYIFLSMPHKKE